MSYKAIRENKILVKISMIYSMLMSRKCLSPGSALFANDCLPGVFEMLEQLLPIYICYFVHLLIRCTCICMLICTDTTLVLMFSIPCGLVQLLHFAMNVYKGHNSRKPVLG